jgi:hypothetical protein
MRHFEEFEIEHLLNATGSWLLRLRCALHLKRCEICRQRKAHIMEEARFSEKLRNAVRCFEEFRQNQPGKHSAENEK